MRPSWPWLVALLAIAAVVAFLELARDDDAPVTTPAGAAASTPASVPEDAGAPRDAWSPETEATPARPPEPAKSAPAKAAPTPTRRVLLPRPNLEPEGGEGPGAAGLTEGGDAPEAGAVGAPPSEAPEEGGMVYAPDAEGIRSAMDEAKPLIVECYEGWLKSNPSLGGRLKVRFTIEAPEAPADDEALARITGATLPESDLDHGLLEGCILNVVSGLRFDPPEGGRLVVGYPFAFEARD